MNPTQTVMSRIGSNFFAILVPGFYVLGCSAFTLLSLANNSEPLSWLQNLSRQASQQWAIALAILLLSYLIGQILHAFAVNRADYFCARIFKSFARTTWQKWLYKNSFPYETVLEETLKILRATRKELPANAIPSNRAYLHTTFNYWKIVLCAEEPEVFSVAQGKEARVRLYSGMFWAGFLGIFTGVVELAGTITRWSATPSWVYFIAGQLTISLVLLTMFGYHLRRIRAQEVETVFIGYLAHREKENKENVLGQLNAENSTSEKINR